MHFFFMVYPKIKLFTGCVRLWQRCHAIWAEMSNNSCNCHLWVFFICERLLNNETKSALSLYGFLCERFPENCNENEADTFSSVSRVSFTVYRILVVFVYKKDVGCTFGLQNTIVFHFVWSFHFISSWHAVCQAVFGIYV